MTNNTARWTGKSVESVRKKIMRFNKSHPKKQFDPKTVKLIDTSSPDDYEQYQGGKLFSVRRKK